MLEQGRLVAVGDAATVFEDQRVIDAYLGVAEVGLMLEIRELEVSYGPVKAVRGIDVDVKMGEVVALIGPNGAGQDVDPARHLGAGAAPRHRGVRRCRLPEAEPRGPRAPRA